MANKLNIMVSVWFIINVSPLFCHGTQRLFSQNNKVASQKQVFTCSKYESHV